MKTKQLLLISSLLLLAISCNKKDAFVAVCDGSNPTYDANVQTIIQQNCIQCHGSGSSNGDFSTYAGLSSVTTNGKFEKEVLTDQTMPQSGPLSEAEQNKLKCWVENGFPEN